MKSLDHLVATLRSQGVSPSEVRAEAWALGVRHHGRLMEGARSELKSCGISIRRAVLLKAVIRSLGN